MHITDENDVSDVGPPPETNTLNTDFPYQGGCSAYWGHRA
jgi:hypothetical protein